jgi:hypothetical protein
MRPQAPRAVFGCALAALSLSCGASAGELYERGMSAYGDKQLDPAVKDLGAFTEKSCGPGSRDPHCRKAYLTLARAYEQRNAPGHAWAAYEAALAFPPHADDAAVQADLDRTHQALAERHDKEATRAPVIIRYRDEVSDEYSARSVVISLDFEPVLTKDKDASELHSPDFRRVYGGSVATGEHVVLVDMVHDCKPGGGVRCARSHVRQAWPFDSVAHTPATIEIRAYAETGEGDAPSRPTLEMISR